MRFACSNLSRNFSKFKSHFLREKLRTLESRKLMPFFIVAYLLAKIKPREILFRQNPIKKLNESDYRKQTINSSQSRLSQTWKTKTRNANPNPNSGFSSL